MEEITTKPGKIIFQVSAVYAVAMLLYTYVLFFMGIDANDTNQSTGFKVLNFVLTYGALLACIFYAQKVHRTNLGGFITFGKAFSTGFKVSVLSGMLLSIVCILYYKFLNPVAFDHLLTTLEANMDSKDMPAEQKEVAMSFTTKYFYIFLFLGLVFGMGIIGSIISLIGAAIVKKERPLFADSTEE